MGTMKKMAMASTIGLAMLSTASFAAVPNAIQKAANQEARSVTKAVNHSTVSIPCKQAALRIAKAAKSSAAASGLKGAKLHSVIANAVSNAAGAHKIAAGCITPAVASSAASAATGMYGAAGAAMGLAKAGLGGAGSAAGAGGALAGVSGAGILGAAAAVVGIAAIANELDDDCKSGDTDC